MTAQTATFVPHGGSFHLHAATSYPVAPIAYGHKRTDMTGEPRPVVHIVHPDATVAKRLADVCAAAGIDTRWFAEPDDFLSAPSWGAPGCLGIHMPLSPTSERERLAHVRSPDDRAPMIVTTEGANVRMAVLAMKAGAMDVFEEPLNDCDILEAVTAAIDADRLRRQAETGHAELLGRFATLTTRERQVMALVTQGRLNKQVAGDLGLSEVTVKVHRGSAMRKMGARTLAALVRMADVVAEQMSATALRGLIT
jgi:FixJ family two-component response regulator